MVIWWTINPEEVGFGEQEIKEFLKKGPKWIYLRKDIIEVNSLGFI